jgi:hypothetical protein
MELELDELEKQEEVPDLQLPSLDRITYRGKTLQEWQDEFTIPMPRLPSTAHEITQVIATLYNKYQTAYNCYSELFVIVNGLERELKAAKFKLMDELVEGYREKGAKAPGKDVLEMLALNKEPAKSRLDQLQKIVAIKEFFEIHKTKLDKVAPIAKDISYSVNQSDRVTHRTEYAGSGQ